jgi:hypothetical protein
MMRFAFDPTHRALSSGFRPSGISHVAVERCRFFVAVAEVQFGMAALSLRALRALPELPRLTVVRRLILSLAGRRLILSIAVLVCHETGARKRRSVDARVPGLRIAPKSF